MDTQAGSLLIRGMTLIDGDGGPPIPDAALLVEQGRIVFAGPRKMLGDVAADETIEAKGKYVVPGLIDPHVHSTFDSDMRAYLKNGVTSIRYAGLNQDAVVTLRERVKRGEIPGPRIFSCGPMLDMSPPAFPHWASAVETPEQARREAVRLLSEDRTEALIVTQRITPALLRPIVEVAHGFGRPVMGQIWATDAREAADLGIDQLDNNSRIMASRAYPPKRLLQYSTISERLGLMARAFLAIDWDLTEPIMEAMLENAVAYCPTLVVTQDRAGLTGSTLTDDPDYLACFGESERDGWEEFSRYVAGGFDAEDRELLPRAVEMRKEWVSRFYEMGGTVLAGSDFQFGGIMLHKELQNLLEIGMSREEALFAATGANAEAMRLDDQIGVLAAGNQADLLLLDRDPLKDLSALRSPSQVFIGGRAVRWDAPAVASEPDPLREGQA